MDNKGLKSSTGHRGEKIRSDCYIEIEITKSSGINIELKSKVASLYGAEIKNQISAMCGFFGLRNAKIFLEDYGALPFVIEARFEHAVNNLFPSNEREYLLPYNKNNNYISSKDRLRRSRLYLPGNEPKFFLNAGLHKPDGIILDLEDSVAPLEKDAARLLVRNALRCIDFYGSERMVRINQLPLGLKDLEYIVPNNVHVILIPKCENPDQVIEVNDHVLRIKHENNIKNDIYLMPIIESALGVIKSFKIAAAVKSNCALTIGLEDYTADIGTHRTIEGKESFFARTMVVNAAKASGIQAIDTVFSDIADMEGLKQSVIEAKSLGFEGKGCIHPSQIPIVHKYFEPTPEEIEKAKKIVLAFEDAQSNGYGVISIGSKMIDAPVVKRAQQTIRMAVLNNLLDENWK